MQSEYPQLHKTRTGTIRNVVNQDNSIHVLFMCIAIYSQCIRIAYNLTAAREFDIRIIYLAKYRDDGFKGI